MHTHLSILPIRIRNVLPVGYCVCLLFLVAANNSAEEEIGNQGGTDAMSPINLP